MQTKLEEISELGAKLEEGGKERIRLEETLAIGKAEIEGVKSTLESVRLENE